MSNNGSGAKTDRGGEVLSLRKGPANANLVYILYLAGLLVPLLSVVDVVMAYVNQSDADDWVRSHYRFQIRTFWIGLLYVFIGCLLLVAVVGMLILGLTAIWIIIRVVKGMKYLAANQPHPEPETWWFG